MLSFQYINDTKTYNVSFEKLNKNHVKILGDIPVKTNGFILGRIGEPEVFFTNQQFRNIVCFRR